MQFTVQPQLIIAGIGVMLAFLFGSLAVYNARRAYRLTKRIADIQGTLVTPSLQVTLGGESDVRHVILAAPFPEERVLELRLPFIVTNVGRKSADNVLIQFSIPRLLCYGGKEILPLDVESEHSGLRGRQLKTRGEIQPFLFEATTIQPNLQIAIALRYRS